ncbi:GTP 3',8-cyclase MoaA [Rhodoferax sp.]|uniref:GTP 3',8-cyclase MoaA n=1 Tax=Rhodoferax sp. TaxID=50421 RepID=UPI0025F6F2E9|nr:GTP 3',8-cyclase MoaA [Rhodoferax sp.]
MTASGSGFLMPPPGQAVQDTLGRPLRDLRISVTDRCNFRCSYCMPKEVFHKDYPYLPHSALLSFEEITKLARQFVALGVQKIRLTGGEPLLRKNIEVLIEQLAAIQTPSGKPLDLTLTTNGSLLAKKAASLKRAGLQRVTVSLDGLDDAVFQAMNDVAFPVADVLKGVDAALAAGLGPIKINMVVKRGTNDHEVAAMARHFKGTGVALRFIEYMDVGATNGWRMDEVVPSNEILSRLRAVMPLVPLVSSQRGETAQRWGHADPAGLHDTTAGEIGFISSVTQAFCGDCNRARLSTEGQLYLCLFAGQGHDLRTLLRSGADEHQLRQAISAVWGDRADRYSALRGSTSAGAPSGSRRVEMSYIGG